MENTTSPSRARFGTVATKVKNSLFAAKANLTVYTVKRFVRRSPYLPFIAVIIIVVVIVVFAVGGLIAKSQGASASSTNSSVSINKPLASQTLNKEFTFPLKDGNGKEVSKITYEIQSVELRNEIIVKGEKATAVAGRAFLVVNLKITNNFNKSISINARDYIRFIVDGSSEKLAPDIHNDPVEVQAISTKPTRVGVAVNDTDRNIVLQVGEIDGKKELIKLDLK